MAEDLAIASLMLASLLIGVMVALWLDAVSRR